MAIVSGLNAVSDFPLPWSPIQENLRVNSVDELFYFTGNNQFNLNDVFCLLV